MSTVNVSTRKLLQLDKHPYTIVPFDSGKLGEGLVVNVTPTDCSIHTVATRSTTSDSPWSLFSPNSLNFASELTQPGSGNKFLPQYTRRELLTSNLLFAAHPPPHQTTRNTTLIQPCKRAQRSMQSSEAVFRS